MQILLLFLRANARKLLRYAGVSVVGVLTGQSFLYLFYGVFGWNAVLSNVLAVTIGSVPSYLLNRAWVWGKTGSHSMSAEVVPFWGMAILGLLVSTVLVHFAEQRWDSWVVVNLANLVGFGVLWVAKFFVLDRVLFRAEQVATAHVETPA